MRESILVPLDGSPFGEHALPYAIGLARESGSTLRLVHVFIPLPRQYGPPHTGGRGATETRRWAEEYLARVGADVRPILRGPVQTEVRTGRTVDGILEAANRPDTTLIVMTSHRRTGLERAWLRSVADGVVRASRRPVLVIPAKAGPARPGQECGFGRILIPLDGSDLSEQVLPVARRWGGRTGSRFTLLRVTTWPTGLGYRPAPDVARTEPGPDELAAREYLAEQAATLAPAWVEVATRNARAADVASVILEEAGRAGADMIALATHGRSGIGRALLGSVADRVLRGSSVPVLLYRPPAVHAQVLQPASVLAAQPAF